MRADVPQAALLPAPRRVERAGGVHGRAQPDRHTPGPPAAGGDVGQPGPHVGVEPVREEDHGRDPGLLHRVDQVVGVRLGQREGLLEQQVLARPGRAGRERRLDIRRDAERDCVDAGQERGLLVVGRGVVGGREVGRGLPVAAEDRGELDPFGGWRARARA